MRWWWWWRLYNSKSSVWYFPPWSFFISQNNMVWLRHSARGKINGSRPHCWTARDEEGLGTLIKGAEIPRRSSSFFPCMIWFVNNSEKKKRKESWSQDTGSVGARRGCTCQFASENHQIGMCGMDASGPTSFREGFFSPSGSGQWKNVCVWRATFPIESHRKCLEDDGEKRCGIIVL